MEQAAKTPQQTIRHFYVAVGLQDQKLTTLLELLTAIQLQAGASLQLSAVIVCSARDVLDSIVCALQGNPLFNVCALHSDLTDKEREFQVSWFQTQSERHSETANTDTGQSGDAASGSTSRRHASEDPSDPAGARAAPARAPHTHPQPPHAASDGPSSSRAPRPTDRHSAPQQAPGRPFLVLVSTEVCLRAIPKELQPLGVSLLIQYDLPTKKEQLNRRVSTVFGGGRERRGGRPACVIDFVVGSSEVELFRSVERFTPTPILEMPVHVGEMFAA